MSNELEKSRIQWQCRRGMLELDVLLSRFLEQQYDQQTTEEKQAFIELLSYPDTDLLAWLTGSRQPADKKLLNIVHKIKENQGEGNV